MDYGFDTTNPSKLAKLIAKKFVECITEFNNGKWQPRYKDRLSVNRLHFQSGKDIDVKFGIQGFIRSVAREADFMLNAHNDWGSLEKHYPEIKEAGFNEDGKIRFLRLTALPDRTREAVEILLEENAKLLPDSMTVTIMSRFGEQTFKGGTDSSDWGDETTEIEIPLNATETSKKHPTPKTPNTNAVKREVYYKTLARPEQASFRTGLLNRYNNTCMITGCTTKAALEAAHIEPFAEGQDDSLKNGLLLRADLHLLFDKKFMAIDPETGAVHFKDVGEDYKDYEQKIVDISEVSREKLAARWKSFKE